MTPPTIAPTFVGGFLSLGAATRVVVGVSVAVVVLVLGGDMVEEGVGELESEDEEDADEAS